jgi:tetratricopeptide (TPR) repeat protein
MTAPLGTELIGKENLQILSINFYRILSEIIISYFNSTPEITLGIINIIGGIVCFWGLYFLAGRLSAVKNTRLLIFFSALASGATLLFFGHIENYTWLAALSIWTFYFALGYINDENGWLPMALFCLLAILWHAIAAYLIIIIFITFLLKKSKQDFKFFNIPNNYLMIVSGAGLFIFILIIQSSGVLKSSDLPGVFVPILPSLDNNYWFLSVGHIVDILNLLFFNAPLGIIFSIMFIFGRRLNQNEDKAAVLLSWFAFLTLMIVFWIDPELGAPRDWDLLSIAGFPISLWGIYIFTKRFNNPNLHLTLIIPAIIVLLLNLSPHIYEKHDTKLAVNRLDRLLWDSPHYQKEYDDGYRCLSWGITLTKMLDEYEISKKYFYRRIGASPNSASALFNLGQVYNSQNNYDSSEIYFEQAARLEPDNKIYMLKLADAKQKQKKFEEALHYLEISERLDPNNATIYTTKGIISYTLGDIQNAIHQFKIGYNMNPNGFDENYNLGSIYYATSIYDQAYPLLVKANQINPMFNDVYEYLIPVMLALGKEIEAIQTLQRYKSINPNAKSLEYYQQQISGK